MSLRIQRVYRAVRVALDTFRLYAGTGGRFDIDISFNKVTLDLGLRNTLYTDLV